MEDGSSAVSGSNLEQHPPLAGPRWNKCIQGVTETTRSYGGERGVGGESSFFGERGGCNFAVWELISGLRVLSDSWGL